MKPKEISNQYRNFILNLSGVLTTSLFFASGIGSYRIFMVYAIHCLTRALNIEHKVIFIFLPAYIGTFYLDLTNGSIFLQTTRPYYIYIIVLVMFVITDTLVHALFKKLISNITQNQYFVECPSCHFNNIQLVETCANCTYKKSVPQSSTAAKISPLIKGDKIPPGLLNLLSLNEGEEILFHKKLSLNTAKYKNGVRQARKHLIITTTNLIILDYYSYHFRIPTSWRERDVIPLSEIKAVEGRMNIFYKGTRPFLIIRTNNDDVYEIILSTFGKYISDIREITSIIKRINPQVEITVELTERPWKEFFKI